MATKWTTNETIELIKLYRFMVELEKQKRLGPAKSKGQISKAQLVRQFIATIAPSRNKQSIELKLMNISHEMKKAGLPLVTGYKSLPNGSRDLAGLIQQIFEGVAV